MDKEKRYKLIFTVVESCVFVIFIVSAIFSIIDFVFYDKYQIFEFFNTLSFRIALIFGILFIILPQISSYIIKLSEEVINNYKKSKFKSEFISETKGKTEVNVLELSKKYELNTLTIKKELEKFISEGILKGELKEDTFMIDKKFGVMDVQERRMKFMKENLKKFISPYKWIVINDISKKFKVPKYIVKEYLEKEILEGKINGFIDGDALIRELSALKYNKKDVFECPYCNGDNLIGSKYCATCGREL